MAHCAAGDVRLFNPTAAFIWRRLEERLSESSIARAVASHFGIPYRVAHGDVLATLDAWAAAGLVTLDGQPQPKARRARPAAVSGRQEVRRRHYRRGDAAFTVRYGIAQDAPPAHRRFHERVVAVLAPLEAARAPGPEVELSIDAEHRAAYGPFCRSILGHLFGPFDWLATLHAAALARGPSAIALCASEGSGKSTLAAFLASRGWRYFNDDLAVVDPSGPTVLPLPVALGVKRGSRVLLEPLYPALRTAPVHRYRRKAARYVAVPRESMATSPAPLGAIVLSRYEAGAKTTLRRVTPAEAAQHVMQAGIIFGPPLRPEMMEWMGRFFQCVPCHRLQYSDLCEAETALRTIS